MGSGGTFIFQQGGTYSDAVVNSWFGNTQGVTEAVKSYETAPASISALVCISY
jgi:hypothetical protein